MSSSPSFQPNNSFTLILMISSNSYNCFETQYRLNIEVEQADLYESKYIFVYGTKQKNYISQNKR